MKINVVADDKKHFRLFEDVYSQLPAEAQAALIKSGAGIAVRTDLAGDALMQIEASPPPAPGLPGAWHLRLNLDKLPHDSDRRAGVAWAWPASSTAILMITGLSLTS